MTTTEDIYGKVCRAVVDAADAIRRTREGARNGGCTTSIPYADLERALRQLSRVKRDLGCTCNPSPPHGPSRVVGSP